MNGSTGVPLPDDTVLSDLGERRIISELIEPRYRSVPSFGDDCAALGADRVITTDSCSTALVSHLGMDDPFHTGWLLATINLSDLAAAGAEPEGLVVNYVLPRDTTAGELRRIIDGVDACASWHSTPVLGGDISEGSELRLTATAVGRCAPRMTPDGPRSTRLGRRGARHGDRLLLVGSPGFLWGAALLHHGYAHVGDADRELVDGRACRPVAQLVAGRLLAAAGLARAATDVSDGLCASVRNLCRSSGLGAVVTGRIELHRVLGEICEQAEVDPFELGQTWGDWCLLVAVAADDVPGARAMLAAEGIGACDIGDFTGASEDVRILDGQGGSRVWNGVDHQHFSPTTWRGKHVKEWLDLMVRRGGLSESRWRSGG